jgi:hypothetical protein
MAIEKALLDQLLAGRDPNEVFTRDGLLDDLKKALSERILNTELEEHLEGERADGGVNRRNGHSKKSVLTGSSKMTVAIPRDRAGTFDPKLIAKYQRRFPDFDDKTFSKLAPSSIVYLKRECAGCDRPSSTIMAKYGTTPNASFTCVPSVAPTFTVAAAKPPSEARIAVGKSSGTSVHREIENYKPARACPRGGWSIFSRIAGNRTSCVSSAMNEWES